MSLKLAQYQTLEQRLTPQQIMLSTLLQLPLLKLEQRIKAELESNPVLELLEEEDTSPPDENSSLDEKEKGEEVDDTLDDFAEGQIEWEDILNDEEAYEHKVPHDPNAEHYEAPIVQHRTMAEHLLQQIQVEPLSDRQQEIANYLIHNIDEDGFLAEDLSLGYIAQSHNVGLDEVEAVLKRIQQLDPTGIGARNLRECLLAQLEGQQKGAALLARQLLLNAYEDVVNKRFERIAKHFALSKEEIRAAMEVISGLNPKPGHDFSEAKENYITPDFIVEKVDDDFIVSLNDWNTPELKISSAYRQMLNQKNGTYGKETRKFLRQKIESANWFINSIQQRRQTMLKVMQTIIEKQRPFFEDGPDALQPMVMREVAESIGMDISTISRVVNDKYVQMDYGVFELRSFFTEKMQTEEGKAISNQRLKNILKQVISEENKAKPLSDDALAKRLKEAGYPIARRTVTKYREQMQIPVARLRREI
jgi:RNA polymerase sigma-54 factor